MYENQTKRNRVTLLIIKLFVPLPTERVMPRMYASLTLSYGRDIVGNNGGDDAKAFLLCGICVP